MSIYYSPSIVRILMDERIREARRDAALPCCFDYDADAVEQERSIGSRIRDLFRRAPSQAPAACDC